MELLDIKEKIWLLDEKVLISKLEDMENDLVAIGGDFHPQRLINNLWKWVFPWFIDDYNYINWYSPKKNDFISNDFKSIKKPKKIYSQ